jgi:hypothetical protein
MAIWDWWLKANGVDLATVGFAAATLGESHSAPSESIPEVQIPGRNGATRTALEPTVASLDDTYEGEIIGTSEQDVQDKLDAFKRLTRGDLTVIIGNQETRQRTGYRKSLTVTPNTGESITSVKVALAIHFDDPVFYATAENTETGSSGADIPLPMGTYRTFGVVTVTGATSPLVLTYKHYDGTTLGSITISAAGTIVVDLLNRTITVDSERNDGARTAGDYFAFDGRDGDDSLAHYPTIRASSGDVSVVYRKGFQ